MSMFWLLGCMATSPGMLGFMGSHPAAQTRPEQSRGEVKELGESMRCVHSWESRYRGSEEAPAWGGSRVTRGQRHRGLKPMAPSMGCTGQQFGRRRCRPCHVNIFVKGGTIVSREQMTIFYSPHLHSVNCGKFIMIKKIIIYSYL